MPMNTGEPQDSGWESGTWLGFAMEIGTDIVMFGQEEGSLSFGVGLGWRGGSRLRHNHTRQESM